MKKLKVFSISAILIAICCSFLFSASVSAASEKRKKLDHKPSGNIYYYDENGHTVKGLVTIRGKKYYFNEKGIQQNGWQKIKGDYYFYKNPQRLLCLHGYFPACKWYLSYQKWRSTL